MKKHLPTLLSQIRAVTKWTGTQMAAELQVSQATVSRILNGQERFKADTYCAVVALHERQCGANATPTKETHDH